MKKNVNAAMRRKEKWENKQKKQTKILSILGIVALVLVVIALALWAIFSINQWRNRTLSEKEMKQLFESVDALPEEDDSLVGTWYYFTSDGDKIHSKYVFSADGKLEVYALDETVTDREEYVLASSAEYRVRESSGSLYVWAKDDENAKDNNRVVVYDYKIKKAEGCYILTWEHEGIVWNMMRVS